MWRHQLSIRGLGSFSKWPVVAATEAELMGTRVCGVMAGKTPCHSGHSTFPVLFLHFYRTKTKLWGSTWAWYQVLVTSANFLCACLWGSSRPHGTRGFTHRSDSWHVAASSHSTVSLVHLSLQQATFSLPLVDSVPSRGEGSNPALSRPQRNSCHPLLVKAKNKLKNYDVGREWTPLLEHRNRKVFVVICNAPCCLCLTKSVS